MMKVFLSFDYFDWMVYNLELLSLDLDSPLQHQYTANRVCLLMFKATDLHPNSNRCRNYLLKDNTIIHMSNLISDLIITCRA